MVFAYQQNFYLLELSVSTKCLWQISHFSWIQTFAQNLKKDYTYFYVFMITYDSNIFQFDLLKIFFKDEYGPGMWKYFSLVWIQTIFFSLFYICLLLSVASYIYLRTCSFVLIFPAILDHIDRCTWLYSRLSWYS